MAPGVDRLVYVALTPCLNAVAAFPLPTLPVNTGWQFAQHTAPVVHMPNAV